MQKSMVLVLAAGLLAMPAAGAATRNSISQQEVATVLEGIGATDIVMSRDSAGDPIVVAMLDTTQFQVLMYGCGDDDRCASIQFRSGYDLDEGMSTDAVNEWNTAMRYGKVWLDDVADPFIELDLDLTGSSDAQVARYAQMWSAMLTEFESQISY
ncbi:MAG TPA: YbjN domain-containing protein [Xanthomonadaceae bacterium]|nr:YbjN domain-containing protein [Xanthomonadaceae bacterium]